MSVLLCVPTHGAICPETVDAAYRICSRHRPEASFRAYRLLMRFPPTPTGLVMRYRLREAETPLESG